MARATHDERDKYRQQAHEAAVAARKAADVAAKAAREARDWARPRAEQAYKSGARKAKPYVHRAGDKAEHWADVVHGAIVGAAIPAVMSAVDRAAADPEDRRNNTWAKVAIPMVIAAAVGAALVVWARRDPQRDEWSADDEWELFGDEGDFPSRLRHDINKTVDLTTDVAKKGAEAVAGAAAVVSEKAAPVVAQVKDTAVAQGRKVASSVESVRFRAAEAIDDVEDVWEDEVAPVVEAAKSRARSTTKKSDS
jgi:hypothetical protein